MSDTPSRPLSPVSPTMSHILHNATATIDELTAALSNFSRVPTPEPLDALSCCCGQDDCRNAKAWLALKTKLESRLILSAEIGQALLHKHEAYLRQQESSFHASMSRDSQYSEDLSNSTTLRAQDELNTRILELEKENSTLEKRLTQALLNNEVTDSSHKTLLSELHEAHATISRLTAHHARSVGWDARLSAITQEKEDMQQERDSELQRARMAEGRTAALKDKCLKLQADVMRLQEEMEQQRTRRARLSEEILQDARERLELLQYSSTGKTVMSENTEVTRVLESLVADNEALKRDNAELQNLLTESREDVRSLREEVEEHRARVTPVRDSSNSPPRPLSHQSLLSVDSQTPSSRRASQQFYPLNNSARRYNNRQSMNLENYRFNFEPLTPETDHRPLSPPNSIVPGQDHLQSRPEIHQRPSQIHTTFALDDESQSGNPPASPEKPKPHIKPLLLLAQSRAVQTDPWPNLPGTSPLLGVSPLLTTSDQLSSSTPPPEARSESSSMVDTSSTFSVLVDRVSTLMNRMLQSDALSLTNRLKRQHLQGADVGHLSRTTVTAIVSDASNLRTHFRAALEDEKILSTCSRKDLRTLLKLLKDLFSELGQLRITLNDVILDPSIAGKVREMAMEPAKAEAERGRSGAKGPVGLGWMAPISRLFSGAVTQPSEDRTSSSDPSSSSPLRPKTPAQSAAAKVVPKLSPALAASTTTVNVEFSSAGKGRAVTSTHSAHPSHADGPRRPRISAPASSKNVMGIFAGAPRPQPQNGDNAWIVIPPKADLTTKAQYTPINPRVGPRSPTTPHATVRFSRNVDAMLELGAGESDFNPTTLLERTLRPRGLSDSSIHSSFLAAGGEAPPPHALMGGGALSPRDTFPDRHSVLQSLSAKVQGLRLAPRTAATSSSSGGGTTPDTASSPVRSMAIPESPDGRRPLSPGRFIPNIGIGSWAAAALEPLSEESRHLPLSSSVREDSVLKRTWARDTQAGL